MGPRHPCWADLPSRRQPASLAPTGCATPPKGVARALRGLGTGALPPLWDRLSELQMGVTLAAGERDAKFVANRPIRSSRSNYSCHRGAGPRCAGHAPHLENPAAIAELLFERLAFSLHAESIENCRERPRYQPSRPSPSPAPSGRRHRPRPRTPTDRGASNPPQRRQPAVAVGRSPPRLRAALPRSQAGRRASRRGRPRIQRDAPPAAASPTTPADPAAACDLQADRVAHAEPARHDGSRALSSMAIATRTPLTAESRAAAETAAIPSSPCTGSSHSSSPRFAAALPAIRQPGDRPGAVGVDADRDPSGPDRGAHGRESLLVVTNRQP